MVWVGVGVSAMPRAFGVAPVSVRDWVVMAGLLAAGAVAAGAVAGRLAAGDR